MLPLMCCVTEPRAQHHGAWGVHVLAPGASQPCPCLLLPGGEPGCSWCCGAKKLGGKWVMGESRPRAWTRGFSPGSERSPDTLGVLYPCAGSSPIPSQPCWKLSAELSLASQQHGAGEGEACPFTRILGWCLLSKANRRVSCWNALA